MTRRPFATRAMAPLAVALVITMSLSGCRTTEEKAEDYFQSGMALLAEGDEERALLEFRNTFKYNGFHQQARKAYADVLYNRGDIAEAYSQYLRLIEQYPDMVDVRLVLARIALGNGDWPEVERHGRAAMDLAPEDPGVKVMALALQYRSAAQLRDEEVRTRVANEARAMLQTQPDSIVLRRIVIDRGLSSADPQTALPDVDAALTVDPDNLEFQSTKLRLLAMAEDMEGTGAQLKVMVERFPDQPEFKTALIQWYLGSNDFEGADAFMRAQAGPADGPVDGHLGVVQLLNLTKGREEGRAELVRLIEANKGTPNADLYGGFLATMDFEDGKTDAAIAAMQSLLASAVASDQTRRLQAILARMLDETGKRDAARDIVATILQDDAGNVDALKLRATWLIAEDKPGQAIQDLRTAQSQAPRDPQIMSLMAAAHERDGSLDLAGEQLAKAVEASGGGPDESLRYAAFLRKQGRTEVAARVLTDARRVSPASPGVLIGLADIYLTNSQWSQTDEIVQVLRTIDTPTTRDAAQRLQAAILMGQNRVDEGLSLLEEGANASNGDLRAIAVLVQSQIRSGKTEEAKRFLNEALAQKPDDNGLILLGANLDALMGDAVAAEAGYRRVIEQDPTAEAPVRLLFGLLVGANRQPEALAVLDAGLAQQPQNAPLLWMKASMLERAADIDGAIAIYEQLYATNSADVIVANNLASLITTYRDDPESLERAFAIARRLRGLEEPAFQDTYGWIEYRRGNYQEAVKYLEPAAKGLPNDPLAQFHLGMTYADLGRKEEAIAQFELMRKLADGRDLPQLAVAETRQKALEAVSP